MALRKLIKLPVLFNNIFKKNGVPGFYFLIYHNVSGGLNFELDMPLSVFHPQLEFLAQSQRVMSYSEAWQALQAGTQPANDAFILTFDDGYREFYTHVFPLLCQYNLPAILFVPTGFVETGVSPLLKQPDADVHPVTWDMLGEMAESGLVTIGAHTHTHPILVNESEDRVIEELVKPLKIFRSQLGLDVRHFAYPRALWDSRTEALVSKYYDSAVICDERKATVNSFHPYRIPRVPIRHSDGWWFFRAKIRGLLQGEEALYERLRQVVRIASSR